MSESLNELFIAPVYEIHSEVHGSVLLKHILMCNFAQTFPRLLTKCLRLFKTKNPQQKAWFSLSPSTHKHIHMYQKQNFHKALFIFSFAMHVCFIIFSILNELKYSKYCVCQELLLIIVKYCSRTICVKLILQDSVHSKQIHGGFICWRFDKYYKFIDSTKRCFIDYSSWLSIYIKV